MGLDVIEIAKVLISTPSLPGSEGDIAGVIRDLLAGMGVDRVFIDRVGNVVAVIRGSSDKPPVLYAGHMDHVDPGRREEWIVDPYEARIIDGKLYGRGSVDMKGSLAAAIASTTHFRENDLLVDYYIVFTVHEETAEGVALRYALEKTLGIKPAYAVIGEATGLNLAIGQRGRAVLYAELYGRSAHASMPWEGINPLVAASKLINWITTDLSEKLPSHELLGRATITPTVIECSPRIQPQIPDYCRLVIDRRLVISESREKAVSEIETCLIELRNTGLVTGYRIGIAEEDLVCWTGEKLHAVEYFPAWIMRDEKLVRTLLSSLRRINPSAREYVWRFSTDGVYTAGIRGIPTIGIGPGDEKLAHKPNEYVPVNELVKTVDAYYEVVKTLSQLAHNLRRTLL
ncbi:MAG: YgeY family selenium metabolism-linked hydrolase [Thermoprotei archaeon]